MKKKTAVKKKSKPETCKKLHNKYCGIVILIAVLVIAAALAPFLYSQETFNLELKNSYSQGEQIDVVVTNNGKEPVTLQVPNGCEKFFDVYKGNKKMQLYDPDLFCTMAIETVVISPGEQKNIGTWDQTYWECNGECIKKVAEPGTYQVVAGSDSEMIKII